MNVLLNAANLRFGGGLTVGLNLIEGLLQQRPEHHFFLLHPRNLGYEQLSAYSNVTLYPVPEAFHTSLLKKLWYNEHRFRRLCRQWQIDKVVALGNICFPAAGRPQLVFIQMPHLVYPESPAWQRMDWRSFMKNSLMDQYAAFHLRYATAFMVQTEVMRGRLCRRFNIRTEQVSIIPNAAHDLKKEVRTPLPPPDLSDGLRLLFLSKYYPHKNFECLIPLARIIKERQLPITITLTIKARESDGAANILKLIRDHDLKDVVQSIGHVPLDELEQVVLAHNGLFLPTLLESSSGAYAEALKYGLPIFTSHYDFATANLGDAALYFDPLHPEHIANVLQQALSQPELIQTSLSAAAMLAAQLPGWEDVTAKFSALVDDFT